MSSNTLTENPIFSPTQIAGCQLWLDAADPINLSRSGSLVTSWTSKGTNTTVVSQSSSNPVFVTNAYNSLPTIRFSFSNTLPLSNASVANSVVQTNLSYGVFLVHNPNANNSTPFGFLTSIGGFPRLSAVTPEGSNISFDGVGGRVNYAYPSQAAYLNGSLRMEGFLSSNSTGFYRRDGSQLATGSLGSGSYSNTQTLMIGGAHPIFPTYYYGGDICEIVWFNLALSLSQIQLTEGYLAWKWGLTGSLPANHPYKSIPVYAVSTVLPPSLQASLPVRMAPSSSPFVFFSPASLPTLATWLDATDLTTLYSDSNGTTLITSNSSPVRYWRDKSTNANHMRVSTAPAPPTFQTGLFNALPGLQFNTAYFNAVTLNKISAQSASMFAMFRSTSSNSAPILYASGNGELAMYPGYFFHRHPGDPDNGVSTTDTLQPNVGEILYNNSTLLYFNNFSNVSPASPVLGTVGNVFFSTYFNVGTYQNGVGYNPQFTLGEVVIYNRLLSTTERQQIEGYLAWKWGLPANLPASHPYKNAPPNATGLALPPVPPRLTMNSRFFSPTSITGCQLWLDAADPTTVVQSGTSVTQWTDKSGQGRNGTLFNANAPSYSSNGINFTGTQAFSTSLTASSTTESGFIVCRFTNFTGNPTLLGCINGQNGRQFRAGGDGTIQTIKQNVAAVLFSGSTLSSNTTYLLEFVNNGTTLTHYLTGATYASGSSVAYDAGLTTGVGGRLQAGVGGLVETLTGVINEVVVFNAALADGQRQRIEGYLAWKWGLQGSLPANHPWKLFPPPPS